MDTIFALSSPAVRSALHLTRVSGSQAVEFLLPFLRTRKSNRKISLQDIQKSASDAKAVVRYFNICQLDGSLVDDVVVTVFFAPHSYTGEESVEIASHGNPLITARIHSLLRAGGARDALAGEFTQRAFLNGRIDLAQAEAVAQLIDSQTEGGIDLARRVSEGTLSQVTLDLQNEFVQALAYLEAHIDFGNDDIGSFDAKTILPDIEKISAKLLALRESFSRGKKILEGVKVALVGKPNAGKSSLYNALLQEDRAIVTDIAGTTRDVITERLVIEKRDFVLLDTAGLRATVDKIESMGIERTQAAAQSADVVLMVADVSEPEETLRQSLSELKSIRAKASHDNTNRVFVLVLNKSDLIEIAELRKLTTKVEGFLKDESWCVESVVNTTHLNCENLRNALVLCYDKLTRESAAPRNAILISKRQQDKVDASLNLLKEAREMIASNDYPEKISSVLQLSHRALGEMLGELSMDSVMEKIFSSFCIGK